jgi:hypothetical protein
MKRIAQMIRCVPRFGYANTEVRSIDVELPPDVELDELRRVIEFYFASRGIGEAVFDVNFDDDGCFAVINDEAYEMVWGQPLL